MILLSFDTEEYDVPREHGVEYDTLTDGMVVSKYGTSRILDVLKENNVRATFFCTANFTENAPDVIRRIIELQIDILRAVLQNREETLSIRQFCL